MPPKRQEDKKHEETADESNLPKAQLWLVLVSLHEHIAILQKYFKQLNLKVLAREELLSYCTEKGLEQTPENLATACKEKLREIETPIRKEKKPEDPLRIDLIVLLKGYPGSYQEFKQSGIDINMCLYLRPPKSYSQHKYLAEQKEISAYPEEFLASQELEDCYWEILEFTPQENMEMPNPQEEVKEEPKAKSKPGKKTEEPKEDELPQDDPKYLFLQKILEKIKSVSEEYINYLEWKSQVEVKEFAQESKSQGVSYYQKILSEGVDDPKFVLGCMVKQVLHNKETFSSQSEELLKSYFEEKFKEPEPGKALGIENSMTILNEADDICKLAHGKSFDLQESIAEAEYCLLKCLEFEELNQQQRDLTPQERGAYYNSLYSFSSLPVPEFKRALVLKDFEEMMKEVQPERNWDFSDRSYEEQLNFNLLLQVLNREMLFDPEVKSKYISDKNTLLLAVFHKTPPGRILRKAWRAPLKIVPSFHHFLHLKDKPIKELLDVSSSKAGIAYERVKCMFPGDNSVIKVCEYTTGPKVANSEQFNFPKFNSTIYKEGVLFGIKEGPEFWVYDHKQRLTVEMREKAHLNIGTEGLVFKMFGSGEILQQRVGDTQECNRVVIGMGNIIRYMKDGTTQIYMANGDTSVLTKEKLWVTTNMKGLRTAKRIQDNVIYGLPALKVSEYTDPESLAVVKVREDLLMKIRYQDQSTAVHFPDGTCIHTSSDGNIVHITAEGFASLRFHKDKLKARQKTVIGLGSTDSTLGADDVMLRSHDGFVVEALFPDGSKLKTFNQVQELEGVDEYLSAQVSLLHSFSGGVLKVTSEGEVVLVTPPTRLRLDSEDPNAHFYELFTVSEERSSGVYSADCRTGKVWTKDNEGNYFEVNAAGKGKENLAVSLSMEEEEINSPEVSEGEYLDEECKFLPPPDTICPPRLFVIKNEQIFEFMSFGQLEYYFHFNQKYHFEEELSFGKVHTFVKPLTEPSPEFSLHYKIPNSAAPMLQTKLAEKTPKPSAYVLRKLTQYPDLTQDKKQTFLQDLENYLNWTKDFQAKQESYIVQDTRSQELKELEEEIQKQILLEKGEFSKIETNEAAEDSEPEAFISLSENEVEIELPNPLKDS